MRLINADKICPDVRTQRGALAISQGQLAYAKTENAVLIPDNATNKDVFKAIFGYEPATNSVVCNKEDWCGASEPCNYCTSNSDNIGKEEDWWNAPYKKAESEGKE